MSPAEFQSGSGRSRLRTQESMERLQGRAKAIRKHAATQIGRLADRRLRQLVPLWREKFPTRNLKIIFGMGSESITIDGQFYHPRHMINDDHWEGETFSIVDDAIRDVIDLTNGYRDGCPDDFVIGPIKARSKP